MKNDGAVNKSINSISSGITRLCDRMEAIKGRTPERIAVMTYLACRITMSFVHEPWFDEALAWLIARDSSIYEILFVAPHYEGHPSLWHLVLAPFARLGVPYELSMNLVSIIFSGIAMALFIYKAPFKRIVRLLMPFTYFCFYQYSVVNRPYCMMMLAFVLMAITYSKRNEHPGRFVLSLWFLCMTGAYGLVVAGGICIVWLLDMLKDRDFCIKKLIWLCLLLLYALFIMYRIFPAKDAFAVLKSNDAAIMPFVLRLLYMAFGMISDLFITNTYSYGITISESGLGIVDILPAVIIGAGILAYIVITAMKKKMLLLFLIPYGMLVVSMSYLYMSRHHMGIALMFIVFYMWVYTEQKKVKIQEAADLNGTQQLKKSLVTIMLSFAMIIPLYWSISSSVIDVFYDYALGRDEYAFLSENGLLDKSILAEWSSMPDNGEETIKPISFSGVITTLLPYMDKDTFLNSPEKAGYNYSKIHKTPSQETTETLIDKIRHDDPPKIIIGEPEYSDIYSSSVLKISDYECMYEGEGGVIWKGVPEMAGEKIYVKKK